LSRGGEPRGRHLLLLRVALALALLLLHATVTSPASLFAQAGADASVSRAASDLLPSGIAMSAALSPAAAAQEPDDVDQPLLLEFLRQMTALDVLFILLWIGIIVFGVTSGVIRAIILIISLLFGALVGALVAGPASIWGGIATAQTRSVALPGTYTIVVILITLAIFIISVKMFPETKLGRYYVIDKVTGAIVGFAAGLVAISVLVGVIVVITSQPWAVLEDTRANIRLQLASTPFLPLVASSFPMVTQMIANSLPIPIKEVCERCL
jgi:hypothetical protein